MLTCFSILDTPKGLWNISYDGLVKSPSALYLLRALHGRDERRSPEMGVRQDAPTIETIVLPTFYEVINYLRVDFA